MSLKIKIFFVDDHKIFARGVALLLSSEKNLNVVGFASSGQEALDFITSTPPDVMITDIQMPMMDGIELTRKVKENYPMMKVIGLSMLDNPTIIKELIHAGADGYLLKDIEKSELIYAIQQVFSGSIYYSGTLAEKLLNGITNKELLTKREKEIIKLIVQENTNIQIAGKLFISEHTVEAHRKNIFRKTKVKSIVGLVNFAHQSKLV